MKFLELEGGYLVIAAFILGVTIFVTTRDFMSQRAFKIAVPFVFTFVAIFILAHYFVTTSRMEEVKTSFNQDKNFICESREIRKVAQSIVISKKLGWQLEDDLFVSPEYERGFHTARCITIE